MTGEAEREAAIEKLQEALRADDADEKDFHVREAIQLLHLLEQTAPADGSEVSGIAEETR